MFSDDLHNYFYGVFFMTLIIFKQFPIMYSLMTCWIFYKQILYYTGYILMAFLQCVFSDDI